MTLPSTFLHLGFTARNEGIDALATSIDVIEHPLLKAGLKQLVADRHDAGLRPDLEVRMEVEVDRLERHHRAATAGLLAVQAGRTLNEITQAVHDAAGGE